MTTDPIEWDELAGQVIVIVFWSFGCEASLLRVRQIESLARRADSSLTCLAVHTPRFPYEEQTNAVESAVAQHRIGLPVVHDPDYLTWNSYNPEGWPATAVVDSRGKVFGMHAGTDGIDVIAESVTTALDAVGKQLGNPTDEPRGSLPMPDADLAFPTSVAVRPNGEVVVVDSGHDRLLVFELAANLRKAIAVAEIGGLDRPYGVTAAGDGLYLSEPALGSVTYLDLAARSRRLIADDMVVPTSLSIDTDQSLVITDSGAEKIYRVIDNGPHGVTMGLIAGSGQTGSRDGSGGEAELAQPMGVARTEVGLVFCDAASSNVRLLTDAGKVATITGSGLFDWGLVDGPAHKAMMQRPSDLAVLADGSIIVVDTGNNRLRRLASRRIRTLGLAGLNRPAGICALESGHLVVADTGNHRLVVVDTDLQTAWPLALQGVIAPRDPDASGSDHPLVSSPGA